MQDFDPELSTTDDAGRVYDLAKMGGGTLGKKYGAGERWLYRVTDKHGEVLMAGDDMESGGMPRDHWTMLTALVDFFEALTVAATGLME